MPRDGRTTGSMTTLLTGLHVTHSQWFLEASEEEGDRGVSDSDIDSGSSWCSLPVPSGYVYLAVRINK